MLQTDDIRKTFRVRGSLFRGRSQLDVLRGVSLSIPPGQTFGLVGESGSGKTTFGRIVLGMEAASAGTIAHRGRDVTHLAGRERRQWRRDAQAVFQDPLGALPHHMRVGRILEEPFRIHHVGRDEWIGVDELLGEVQLPRTFADRYPHELSGGQRQRVVIARALALRPSLVVCDEPVSALDVSVQAHVLELLRSLQASHRLTYLFISHDLGVVRYISDVVGVLYHGRLVEVGPPQSVYRNPSHPYTRLLLDAIPSVRQPARPAATRPSGARSSADAESGSSVESPMAAGCRFRDRCPLAGAECATSDPPLLQVGPRRWTACHHAEAVHDRSDD